jgi:thiol:disulfide interchange protein DsbD
LASGFVQAQAPSNDGTQAELWLEARQASAGESIMAGVHLQMPPGWHTYWRNPGDSGAPTEIEWDLPEGVTAGAIQWPVPEKFVVQELTSYGYHDEVVLLVPLELAADLAKGELTLKAEVNWLECKELCIPGSAQVSARLDVGDSVELSSHAAALQEWKNKLPEPAAAQKVTAQWDGPENEKTRPLVITWEAESIPEEADFYPYPGGDYEVIGETERFPVEANQVRLRKDVIAYDAPWPDRLPGLIVGRTPGAEKVRAFEKVLNPGSRQPSASASPSPLVVFDTRPRPFTGRRHGEPQHGDEDRPRDRRPR